MYLHLWKTCDDINHMVAGNTIDGIMGVKPLIFYIEFVIYEIQELQCTRYT